MEGVTEMDENKPFLRGTSPAINIIGKEKCTGCFGCANACPISAIRMKLSEDGFFIPDVDENKCTNCGICAQKCPIINYNSDNLTRGDIKVYAAFSTNSQTRLVSSSGGLFTEIAEYLLQKGFIIFGAGWTKDLKVEHFGVKAASQLHKLRSSKYIQSFIGTTYLDINNLIKYEGKKVLFIGTPCQVAAIRMLIKSDNLITIDLVCHGVPSKIIFDEYLKYVGKDKKVLNYTFRDKSLGWSKYMVKAKLEDNSIYECITRQDPFFKGFICDLYSNMPCYDCKFSTIPRAGDITLGDFWKISDDLMDERGVSVALANNQKGLGLLNELEKVSRIKLYAKGLEDALIGNPRIHDGHLNMRIKRKEILSKVKKEGFEYIMENYISKTERYVPDRIK